MVCGMLAGCSGRQSALAPHGEEAEAVSHLFWVMVAGGSLVWLGVMTLLLLAAGGRIGRIEDVDARHIVFWGGAAFPTVVLVSLLGYALWLMPGLRSFSPAGASQFIVEVTGRQFWWDVVYRLPDGNEARTANEIVLPVGRRVELSLKSTDVIHSFWIPSLAGKMDMIPGRTNRLPLIATKAGRFRGPCAEYCGTSHALMAFDVTVLPVEEFAAWLRAQAEPASSLTGAGAELFERYGCASCHRVMGTMAGSRVGPDLSHVGSRQTLGAGILPNTAGEMERFIANPNAIKPGAHMPAFDMAPPEDIRAIATWLKGLE